MDSQQDPQANTPADRSPQNASRRQIIRGMASLPVVLTLSNAHAQAVASNLQCITKSASAVDALITETADANDRNCIPADDPSLSGISPPRTDPLTGNPIRDTGPGTPVRTIPGGELNGINYDAKSCVYYVDADGNPVGFSENAGLPTAASCYTSFT